MIKYNQTAWTDACFHEERETSKPDTIHPIAGYDQEIYVKPTVNRPNIVAGALTDIADPEFERHVAHHPERIGCCWNSDGGVDLSKRAIASFRF